MNQYEAIHRSPGEDGAVVFTPDTTGRSADTVNAAHRACARTGAVLPCADGHAAETAATGARARERAGRRGGRAPEPPAAPARDGRWVS
ncbi:hypothetical protein ACIRQQ_22815 [Streptomyces fuscichromogenes]|uniref:hypothetical protein n=1 Tax=Streptomyces fuscichromogenes TaxID=1324013 RepID=UPI0037F8D5B8